MVRTPAVKKILAVGAVMLALLLSGCGPKIMEGHVIDKSYSAAYFYTTNTPICSGGYGSQPRICTPMIQTHHVPESWRLDIDYPGDGSGWVSVSEADYEAHGVGDWWER